MDWSKVRNSPGHTPEPRLELGEFCWQMRSLQKATRMLSCGIYRPNAPGLEVRAGYSGDDLLRSQRTADIGSAREIADAWRRRSSRRADFSKKRKVVMANKKNDAEAEREYLHQRIAELRGKAGASVAPEVAAQFSRNVADALRTAGHEALALRYAAAFQRLNRASAELERANAEGQINEAAHQAMNDALEDFERVEAEVWTVLDGRPRQHE